MEKKINWKPYIIAGSISLGFAILIFCLFFFVFQKALIDGFAFAGISLVAYSLLSWIAREGFFDIFSYGFRQMGNMMYNKKANEFNDYSGYKEYKYEIRKKKARTYLAIAAVGVLFLLITLIIYLVTKL